MSVEDFDGFVFDLDGVLVDTWRFYLGIYKKVFGRTLGREFSDSELIDKARTTETGTLKAVLPPSLFPDGLERFRRCYSEIFDELATPYARAVQSVAAARELGKRIGIFTGKMRSSAVYSLERIGVLGFVESLSTEEDCVEPKPHPGGLKKIIRELDLDPSRTLYIGDQRIDIEAGRSAGAVTAAALWAEYATARFDEGGGPDLCFSTEDMCLAFFNHRNLSKMRRGE